MGRAGKLLDAFLLLAHGTALLLWMTSGGLHYLTRVFGPSLYLDGLKNRKSLGNCGPTTQSFEDLIVTDDMSDKEALDLIGVHGAAVVENVVSKESAQIFRDWVMKNHDKVQNSFVLRGENRHRAMPPHTEPTMQDVLGEMANNVRMRLLAEGVMGPEPTLIAASVITNLHGAVSQGWHEDTTRSDANYPELFVPLYSITIALQDTTPEMGATGLCPGTHKCHWPDFPYKEWEKQFEKDEYNFEKYDGKFNKFIKESMPCKVTANLKQGDALIYNTDMWHRGGAHIDVNAPDRATFFVSFASSRHGKEDNRTLPFGKVYSLDWRMWGQTWSDCANMKTRAWRLWHTFGFFNGKGSIRPFTLLDSFLYMYRADKAAWFIGDHFKMDSMWDVADDVMLLYWGISGLLYTITVLRLWNYFSNSRSIADAKTSSTATKVKTT